MKVTRRKFIELLLIGGSMYLASDLISHGPTYSYIEILNRPISTTITTNIKTTSEEDEFKAFKEEYPELAKRFNYRNYKSALKYFEAMPELKKEEDLYEFLNIHIRQWDLILYTPCIPVKSVQDNRGLISYDDTSFDDLRIKDLKYHLKLDEREQSLLPIRKEELERLFPNEYDREIINRIRTFHALLTMYNGRTGDDVGKKGFNNWTIEDAKRSIIDNMSLVLDGSIYERITKMHKEKREDIAKKYFDEEEVMRLVYAAYPFSVVYRKAGQEFLENYLPIVKDEEILNLGMRLTSAIAFHDVIEVLRTKPENRVYQYILYTKALGYAGSTIMSDTHEYGWPGDETIGSATPQYIIKRLPKEGRYSPGNMLSPFVYGYDSNGKKLKLSVILPDCRIVYF